MGTAQGSCKSNISKKSQILAMLHTFNLAMRFKHCVTGALPHPTEVKPSQFWKAQPQTTAPAVPQAGPRLRLFCVRSSRCSAFSTESHVSRKRHLQRLADLVQSATLRPCDTAVLQSSHSWERPLQWNTVPKVLSVILGLRSKTGARLLFWRCTGGPVAIFLAWQEMGN